MGNKVTIIDYGYGNLYSLQSAFNKLKINSVITELPEVIEKAEIIVLPGVGSFYQAMKAIKKRELHIIIKKAVRKNTGILGICLGYQMLFKESEEFGVNEGLGVLDGKVVSLKDFRQNNLRIPNVGWRTLIINKQNSNFSNLYEGKHVYFVHSFIPKAKNQQQVSTFIKFGEEKIHTSVHYKNIVGFQFHPEKSGKVGLHILRDAITYLVNRKKP